jgi:hypothetical protein
MQLQPPQQRTAASMNDLTSLDVDDGKLTELVDALVAVTDDARKAAGDDEDNKAPQRMSDGPHHHPHHHQQQQQQQQQETNWSFASAPPMMFSMQQRQSPGPQRQSPGGFRLPAYTPEQRSPNASMDMAPAAAAVAGHDVRVWPLEKALFDVPRVKTAQPDDAAALVKLFVGNMRFEMTREALRWVFNVACGVDIPETHILIHVRASSNNCHTPTGCASLFVPEGDVDGVIGMNQRIFCNATTLFVTPTSAGLARLIEERRILDTDAKGKKLRGPKNSMVVERSKSSTPSPNHSQGPTPNASFFSGNSFANSDASFSSAIMSAFASPPNSGPLAAEGDPSQTPPLPSDSPTYERYPLQLERNKAAGGAMLVDPVELFVGGIRYEATAVFVAWLLRRAMQRVGVTANIADEHVTLFTSNKKKKTNNAGCALVRVERHHTDTLLRLNHCILCDAFGAYYSPSEDAMARFIRTYQDKMRGGPSHAVVIETRKNGNAAPAGGGGKPYNFAGGMGGGQHFSNHGGAYGGHHGQSNGGGGGGGFAHGSWWNGNAPQQGMPQPGMPRVPMDSLSPPPPMPNATTPPLSNNSFSSTAPRPPSYRK